ncbi:spc24 [Candida jiufengensis]|uniref:spc24 n=1 Tax=Candida jiufengensis TaxID=497108 RepID=UPI0022240719|nr:spc24 [Candida jiufengensis]KAI5951451.1 spc24 [Candida jiufengensis]
MTSVLHNDQPDIPSHNNDDLSVDPINILQQLIDQLNSGDEFLAIEQIQSIINNQNITNTNEISKTNETITNLKNEIDLKQKSIQMLNKLNDINYELIQTYTSSIKPTTTPNKSENIFQLIKSKSIEMENYKVKIIKELQDLTSSINILNSNELKLNNEIQQINENIKDSINNFQGNLNLNNNELLEQDLTILLINLYKNLGMNLESAKKITGDNENNQDFNSQNPDNYLDEPEDFMIISGKDDTVTALALEARYTEEFISNFIWDKID